MKKILILSLLSLFLFGCDEEEDLNPVAISVTEIKLTPIGQIQSEESFKSEYANGELICTLRTKRIRKNDQIKYVIARKKDKELTLSIETYPHEHGDFCFLDSCMLYQDVSFHLIELKSGKYSVTLIDNGLERHSFDLNLKENFYTPLFGGVFITPSYKAVVFNDITICLLLNK